jgi:hypothetical protein
MKWILVAFCIIAALVCFGVAALYSIDPEGRGGSQAGKAFIGVLVFVCIAIAAALL